MGLALVVVVFPAQFVGAVLASLVLLMYLFLVVTGSVFLSRVFPEYTEVEIVFEAAAGGISISRDREWRDDTD